MVKRKRKPQPDVKESDVRITPEPVRRVFFALAGDRRTCDVATEPNNPMGADRIFTLQDNALTCRWAVRYDDVHGCTYWLNPPYSLGQIMLFAVRATFWARLGLEIVVLTPADTSTGWYEFLRNNADARCHFDSRVQFLEPDGEGGYRKCSGGAKTGSAAWYFGPRRRRFARIFGELGEILHGLGPQEET